MCQACRTGRPEGNSDACTASNKKEKRKGEEEKDTDTLAFSGRGQVADGRQRGVGNNASASSRRKDQGGQDSHQNLAGGALLYDSASG